MCAIVIMGLISALGRATGLAFAAGTQGRQGELQTVYMIAPAHFACNALRSEFVLPHLSGNPGRADSIQWRPPHCRKYHVSRQTTSLNQGSVTSKEFPSC